jgi:L-alanine-DL-glutamate epimerase-like enolase superfamily enzyme
MLAQLARSYCGGYAKCGRLPDMATAHSSPLAPHAPLGFGASFLAGTILAYVVQCTQSFGLALRA